MKLMHAFFSATAEKKWGSVVYKNEENKNVTVTYISSSPLEIAKKEYKWPDKVYVGMIDFDQYVSRRMKTEG